MLRSLFPVDAVMQPKPTPRSGQIGAQRCGGLGRSLSPLLGQPNSGIPEFGQSNIWPKSDKSDFG